MLGGMKRGIGPGGRPEIGTERAMTVWQRFGVALCAAVVVLGFVLGVGGCARQRPTELVIAPGQYAEAFDAARDVLRESRYRLERVDGRAGVISTASKNTPGLVAPWEGDSSTLVQGVEDMINRHRRVVRVTFEPAIEGAAPAVADPRGPVLGDLREYEGPVVLRVSVLVEREHHSGWRIDTADIRSSGRARDLLLARRELSRYTVALKEDSLLAGRLAARIQGRLGAGARARGAVGLDRLSP